MVSASGDLTGDAAWLDIQERSGQRVNSPGSKPDGVVAFDERVWGCYLHARFENETLRRAWLRSPGWLSEGRMMNYDRRKALDESADHVEAALDMERIRELVTG